MKFPLSGDGIRANPEYSGLITKSLCILTMKIK